MLAEREIAPSSPLPLEASWAVVSTSWDPSDASKYYRARYYDPKLGRFISEDPIGFVGGPNLYSYVGNDPTVLVDPLGLQESPIGIGAERRNIATELGPAALANYDARTLEGLAYGNAMVAALALGVNGPALWTELRIAMGLGLAGAGPAGPILGNKLDYVCGRAGGTAHNIERSQAMLRQLESVGLYDTPATRAYLAQLLTQAARQPGTLQANGRVLQQTLVMGPNGGLRMDSVWEGSKLITVMLFGGK